MTKHVTQGTRLATAAVALALLGCVKGEQANSTADSTARNLTLAPTESTAALRDIPARPVERAQPAPEKRAAAKAAAPRPTAPPAPTTVTAAAGTRVALAVSDTLSTRHVKAGDTFTATVSHDVTDAAGRVVIPAGSSVEGTIDAADARHPTSAGRLALSAHNVTVRGARYAIAATVIAMDTVEQGRGVTAGDAEKVGVGAAAGALLGKLIGKDAKGTIIGGVAGAAGGAAIARETRSIDIVLPKGAGLTLQLDQPLTVKRR
ncbi:MAG TPA: glycine zipper domain-containing protein [Gemmatimonadales bacterium]|nr:glycine zipper domain-containing protein [Gemmatimonadales bacterium]